MWLPRQACSQAGTAAQAAPNSAAATMPIGHHQPDRQVAVERQDRQAAAQPAEIGLALAADVEQAAMEGDRHGQAGEDEVGGVVERVADRLRRADRARDQQLERMERIDADDAHDDADGQEGERDVDQRQQRRCRPSAAGDGGPAHAAARLARRFGSRHHQAERALVGAAALAPRRRCGRRTSPGCGRRATGSRRARPTPPARRSPRRGSSPARDG